MAEQPRRPLLLGHRGARISDPRIPENSFPAFDLALQEGCDGFEFDVRCTKNGRLLICHDPDFFGQLIASATYEDLQQLWDRDGVSKLLVQQRANVSEEFTELPCLDHVLGRYAATAFLDIELKVTGTQKAVDAALRNNPPQGGYVVSSFLPEALFEMRAQNAAVPLGLICDKKKDLALWPSLPVEFVIPHHKLLSRDLIEELHNAGKKVFTWTVNDARDMLRFAEWQVDALISDDPRLLSKTFR